MGKIVFWGLVVGGVVVMGGGVVRRLLTAKSITNRVVMWGKNLTSE